MKILLLSPPMKYRFVTNPPLGIAYLQSILEKNNYEVKSIDMFNYSFKKCEKEIRKYDPDIVGISCFTNERANSFKLAEICKNINPDIKVIMGGPHATFLSDQIISNFPVDFIVRNEGEVTILELIKTLEKGKNLKNVLGITFRKNGKIFKNKDRPFIKNLDEIPFPEYRDFDLKNYFPKKTDIDIYSPLSISRFLDLRSLSIITSRGCPFNCQFCSTSRFWGGCWRFRSARNVVDEIELLYYKYKIKFFNFADDVFSINQKRVIEICKEIIKRKLDLFWSAATRVDFISKKMLEWMKKSNCIQVQYGVESGSPKILKNIKKQISINQIIRAFEISKKLGLMTHCFLIIGNPGENKQTINETIKLLDIIKPDSISPALPIIFPNTPLYELAMSKGLIDEKYWLTDKPAPIYTGDLSLDQLRAFRLKVMNRFLSKQGFYTYIRYGFFQLINPKSLYEHLISYFKVNLWR